MRKLIAAIFFLAAPLLGGPATHLGVTTQYLTATSGVPFQFTVAALDASDAVDEGYRGTVEIAMTGGVHLPLYTFTPADAGSHTFTATMACSGCFDLNISVRDVITQWSAFVAFPLLESGTPAGLHAILLAPPIVAAGSEFPLIVELRDGPGNLVSMARRVWIGNDRLPPVLGSPYDFTEADHGTIVVPFTLFGSPNGIFVKYAPSMFAVAKIMVAVGPPEAKHFSITAPDRIYADNFAQYRVTALDADNGVVTGYRGRVHFGDCPSIFGPVSQEYTFTSADAGSHLFSCNIQWAGTYPLRAYDVTFPSITGSTLVKVWCPGPPIITNDGPACKGDWVTITAYHYWYITGPDGFYCSAGSICRTNVPGLYTAVWYGHYNGCYGAASTEVVFEDPPPGPPITVAESVIEATPNYVASVTPVDGATGYSWSIDDGFITRGATTPTCHFTTGAAGHAKLTLRVAKPHTCAALSTKTLAVRPRPTASLPSELATCGPGDIEIPVTLTGTPPFALVWSDGATQRGIAARTTSRTVNVFEPASLSIVSVTDANATGSASNVVALDVDSQPEIGAPPADATVRMGDTATFALTAFGSNLHYAWFFGEAGDVRTPVGTDSPSYTTWAVTKPLTFWARVWNGCGALETAAVTATPLPPRPRPAGH